MYGGFFTYRALWPLCLGRGREHNGNSGADILPAQNLHVPAMLLRDPLRNGYAQPRSARGSGTGFVGAKEPFKNLRNRIVRDTNTFILISIFELVVSPAVSNSFSYFSMDFLRFTAASAALFIASRASFLMKNERTIMRI